MSSEYTTVTSGMRGYFAVIADDEGPIQSSPITCATFEEAAKDAMSWAENEGIPCKVKVEDCRHTDVNCTCY